jgi:hypothetical protein
LIRETKEPQGQGGTERHGEKGLKVNRLKSLIVAFQSSIIELIEISHYLTMPVPTNGGIILRNEGSVVTT